MRNSGRRAAHQRKIYMALLIAVIILAVVLGGGYYFLSQTEATSKIKDSVHAETAQTEAVLRTLQ